MKRILAAAIAAALSLVACSDSPPQAPPGPGATSQIDGAGGPVAADSPSNPVLRDAQAASSGSVQVETFPFGGDNPVIVQVQGVYSGAAYNGTTAGRLTEFSCAAVAPEAAAVSVRCYQFGSSGPSLSLPGPAVAIGGSSEAATSRICFDVTATGLPTRRATGCSHPIFIPNPDHPTLVDVLLGRTVPDASGYPADLLQDALDVAELLQAEAADGQQTVAEVLGEAQAVADGVIELSEDIVVTADGILRTYCQHGSSQVDQCVGVLANLVVNTVGGEADAAVSTAEGLADTILLALCSGRPIAECASVLQGEVEGLRDEVTQTITDATGLEPGLEVDMIGKATLGASVFMFDADRLLSGISASVNTELLRLVNALKSESGFAQCSFHTEPTYVYTPYVHETDPGHPYRAMFTHQMFQRNGTGQRPGGENLWTVLMCDDIGFVWGRESARDWRVWYEDVGIQWLTNNPDANTNLVLSAASAKSGTQEGNFSAEFGFSVPIRRALEVGLEFSTNVTGEWLFSKGLGLPDNEPYRAADPYDTDPIAANQRKNRTWMWWEESHPPGTAKRFIGSTGPQTQGGMTAYVLGEQTDSYNTYYLEYLADMRCYYSNTVEECTGA